MLVCDLLKLVKAIQIHSDRYGLVLSLQDGEWFHYDDSYVQPIRFCNVVRDCQQDGYLFFYVNRAILPVMTGKAPARK